MDKNVIKRIDKNVLDNLQSTLHINNVPVCVNELVLNSLDANATAIAVRLNLLSFRIQVVDNGTGITGDNLQLIGDRYMTSKCHGMKEYLNRMKHFGFRGEALASIRANCKRVIIASRTSESSVTLQRILRQTYADGEEDVVIEISQRPSQGTTITVEDFLYQTPVRRKSVNIDLEFEEIKRNLMSLALVYPYMDWSLRNDVTKTIYYKNVKTDSVDNALMSINPEIKACDIMQLRLHKKPYSITGLICKSLYTGNKMQYMYVNKRPITTQQLQEHVVELLKERMILKDDSNKKSGHFVFLINIKWPLAKLDIFIEGTKCAVHFKNDERIDRWLATFVNKILKTNNLLNPIEFNLKDDNDNNNNNNNNNNNKKSENKKAIRPKIKSQIRLSDVAGVKMIKARKQSPGDGGDCSVVHEQPALRSGFDLQPMIDALNPPRVDKKSTIPPPIFKNVVVPFNMDDIIKPAGAQDVQTIDSNEAVKKLAYSDNIDNQAIGKTLIMDRFLKSVEEYPIAPPPQAREKISVSVVETRKVKRHGNDLVSDVSVACTKISKRRKLNNHAIELVSECIQTKTTKNDFLFNFDEDERDNVKTAPKQPILRLGSPSFLQQRHLLSDDHNDNNNLQQAKPFKKVTTNEDYHRAAQCPPERSHLRSFDPQTTTTPKANCDCEVKRQRNLYFNMRQAKNWPELQQSFNEFNQSANLHSCGDSNVANIATTSAYCHQLGQKRQINSNVDCFNHNRNDYDCLHRRRVPPVPPSAAVNRYDDEPREWNFQPPPHRKFHREDSITPSLHQLNEEESAWNLKPPPPHKLHCEDSIRPLHQLHAERSAWNFKPLPPPPQRKFHRKDSIQLNDEQAAWNFKRPSPPKHNFHRVDSITPLNQLNDEQSAWNFKPPTPQPRKFHREDSIPQPLHQFNFKFDDNNKPVTDRSFKPPPPPQRKYLCEDTMQLNDAQSAWNFKPPPSPPPHIFLREGDITPLHPLNNEQSAWNFKPPPPPPRKFHREDSIPQPLHQFNFKFDDNDKPPPPQRKYLCEDTMQLNDAQSAWNFKPPPSPPPHIFLREGDITPLHPLNNEQSAWNFKPPPPPPRKFHREDSIPQPLHQFNFKFDDNDKPPPPQRKYLCEDTMQLNDAQSVWNFKPPPPPPRKFHREDSIPQPLHQFNFNFDDNDKPVKDRNRQSMFNADFVPPTTHFHYNEINYNRDEPPLAALNSRHCRHQKEKLPRSSSNYRYHHQDDSPSSLFHHLNYAHFAKGRKEPTNPPPNSTTNSSLFHHDRQKDFNLEFDHGRNYKNDLGYQPGRREESKAHRQMHSSNLLNYELNPNYLHHQHEDPPFLHQNQNNFNLGFDNEQNAVNFNEPRRKENTSSLNYFQESSAPFMQQNNFNLKFDDNESVGGRSYNNNPAFNIPDSLSLHHLNQQHTTHRNPIFRHETIDSLSKHHQNSSVGYKSILKRSKPPPPAERRQSKEFNVFESDSAGFDHHERRRSNSPIFDFDPPHPQHHVNYNQTSSVNDNNKEFPCYSSNNFANNEPAKSGIASTCCKTFNSHPAYNKCLAQAPKHKKHKKSSEGSKKKIVPTETHTVNEVIEIEDSNSPKPSKGNKIKLLSNVLVRPATTNIHHEEDSSPPRLPRRINLDTDEDEIIPETPELNPDIFRCSKKNASPFKLGQINYTIVSNELIGTLSQDRTGAMVDEVEAMLSDNINKAHDVDDQQEQVEIIDLEEEEEEEEKDNGDWISFDNFYVHKRTGEKVSQIPAPFFDFDIKARGSVLPKGFSPIAKATPICLTLTPTSRHHLYEAIFAGYENELNIVKWRQYITNPQDPDAFFTALYKELRTKCDHIATAIDDNPIKLNTKRFTKDVFKTISIIGQLDKKFIIGLIEKKLLVLFDQHAVHERIRVERLYKDYIVDNNVFKNHTLDKSFKLAFPKEYLKVLENFKDAFIRFGFDYEINDGLLRIKKIPLCFYNKSTKSSKFNTPDLSRLLLEEECDSIITNGIVTTSIPKVIQNVVNSEACRGAIMFGESLNIDECIKYVMELAKCDLPFQCAHGRPTIIPLMELNHKALYKEIRPGPPNLKKLRKEK